MWTHIKELSSTQLVIHLAAKKKAMLDLFKQYLLGKEQKRHISSFSISQRVGSTRQQK